MLISAVETNKAEEGAGDLDWSEKAGLWKLHFSRGFDEVGERAM